MSASCASCKHHSHTRRARIVGVFDGDLEMIEEDDETLEDVYFCTHPEKSTDLAAVGPEQAETRAKNCSLFTIGRRSTLSPELERLLAQSAERAVARKE